MIERTRAGRRALRGGRRRNSGRDRAPRACLASRRRAAWAGRRARSHAWCSRRAPLCCRVERRRPRPRLFRLSYPDFVVRDQRVSLPRASLWFQDVSGESEGEASEAASEAAATESEREDDCQSGAESSASEPASRLTLRTAREKEEEENLSRWRRQRSTRLLWRRLRRRRRRSRRWWWCRTTSASRPSRSRGSSRRSEDSTRGV